MCEFVGRKWREREKAGVEMEGNAICCASFQSSPSLHPYACERALKDLSHGSLEGFRRGIEAGESGKLAAPLSPSGKETAALGLERFSTCVSSHFLSLSQNN